MLIFRGLYFILHYIFGPNDIHSDVVANNNAYTLHVELLKTFEDNLCTSQTVMNRLFLLR